MTLSISILFTLIGAVILLFWASFAGDNSNQKHREAFCFIFGFVIASLIFTISAAIDGFKRDNEPKAIDVYRGKTSIVIEGFYSDMNKDSTLKFIPTDSTVVFINKKD